MMQNAKQAAVIIGATAAFAYLAWDSQFRAKEPETSCGGEITVASYVPMPKESAILWPVEQRLPEFAADEPVDEAEDKQESVVVASDADPEPRHRRRRWRHRRRR